MKIKTKIVGLGVLAASLTAGVIAAVLITKQRSVSGHIEQIGSEVVALRQQVADQQLDLLKSNAAQVVQTVWQAADASEKRTSAQLTHALEVAHAALERAGGFRLGAELVAWKAVNQFTHETQDVQLPVVMLGGAPLERHDDRAQPVRVVDEVHAATGDFCTIFQRINEAGDMLRVGTSVLDRSGRRAVGTFIPRRSSDGSENPALRAVLAGTVYRGRAQVMDDVHATAYEPIWDPAHARVVGMLYVGVSVGAVTRELRESIQHIKVGKTGYVYVLGGHGALRGTYIVSSGGKRDGENIWESRSSDGRLFIQDVINQATAAPPGDVVYASYPWQNAGEAQPRNKIAAVVYHPASDWVIGASCYEDDVALVNSLLAGATARMLERAHAAGSEFRGVAWWVLVTGGAMVLLSIAIGWWLARAIGHSLGAGVRFAEQLARGDLSGQLQIRQRDEVGVLASAMNEMATRLRDAFGRVAGSVTALNQSSTQLGEVSGAVSSVAEETSAQANVVASAAGEVSTSVATVANSAEEMTTSIREISQQTAQAAHVAAQAAQLAGQANATIVKLGDSSAEIGNVVKVITSIADQTNLLALNATIEAARAGDAGRGFGIVANEVKELARQTSRATEEIRAKVAAIQSDAQGAVVAIKGIADVIAKVNQTQTTIASAIEQQAATMSEISRHSAEGSRGTAEIATNINSVSQAARSTTASATSTAAAARELSQLAGELRDLVSAFKLEAGDAARAATTVAPARPAAAQAEHAIVWDAERMATGVSSIDEQHQELIRRINQLYAAVSSGAVAAEIEPMLQFLEQYTRDHFAHEEQLMDRHVCPARGANQAAYKKFLENLAQLSAEFRARGPTLKVLDALRLSVGDWLAGHICKIDKQLGGCAGARAARRESPAAAHARRPVAPAGAA